MSEKEVNVNKEASNELEEPKIDDGSGTGLHLDEPMDSFNPFEKMSFKEIREDFKVMNKVDSYDQLKTKFGIRKRFNRSSYPKKSRVGFKDPEFKRLFDPRPILTDTDRLIEAANGLKYALYTLAVTNLVRAIFFFWT